MFKTLETFDTELSADSVEWCPAKNYQNIFVCGTYELKNEATRVGRMYLFKVVSNEKVSLKLLQKLDGAAILDMKWAHIKCFDKILLGVAKYSGFLEIYELIDASENSIYLNLTTKILIKDEENVPIVLSLDWSTGRKNHNEEVKIIVSDSLGSITLFNLHNASGLEKIISWPAHEFEAWITAFDYWNTNVIFTGGDDGKFLRFDTRIHESISAPTNTNRSHEAGVTSFHSNPEKEFYLVSGSYDEQLRTWDTRQLRRPASQLNLGGGVWRLKWEPRESRQLLAACMYGGFRVLEASDPTSPKLLAEYNEHESIAYGCDWSHLSYNEVQKLIREDETVESSLLGTCSFYDHCLKLSVFSKVEK